MKKLIILLIVLVAIGYIYFSGDKGDDSFFNSYFTQMVDAGKSKNVDDFMDFFSKTYRDEDGMSYVVIKNIVRNEFERYDRIDALFSDLSSRTEKDSEGVETAIVNMDVLADGIRNGVEVELIGKNGGPENITIFLEKSSFGSWKIVKIEGVEKNGY